MKRREFIGIAAAGAASLALPVAARGSETGFMPLAQPRLLEILRDERLVHEIGQRYRENVPLEDNADVLLHAILGQAPVAGSVAGDGSLRPRLDAQVQQDFISGHTVTLNGWVLSVTEARQCALFSLLGS